MGNKVFLLFWGLALLLIGGASAVEIEGVPPVNYYGSTEYQTVYGTRYTYGGTNPSEYRVPALPFGVVSGTSAGVMERTTRFLNEGTTGFYGISTGGALTIAAPTAFTSSTSMRLSDGSIGTLSIPSLGIYRKAWDGEFADCAAKGLWHDSLSSGWDGNVVLFGHNRGTGYAIGSINRLSPGDLIYYTTVYGTRTYQVAETVTISNTDRTRLQATADNRITLVTCLADHPEVRVCVQAREKT